MNDPKLLKEYLMYRELKKGKHHFLSYYCDCITYDQTHFISVFSTIAFNKIRTVIQSSKYEKIIKNISNRQIEISMLLKINDITDMTNEQVLEKFNKSEYVKTLEYKINEKAHEEKEINETEQKIKYCTLKQIELQEKLHNLKQREKLFQRITVPQEYFFTIEEDHKKIREEFLEKNRLKYIDLILFNFDNTDIHGIDFRDTNAIINPQTVYRKDLSYCNFDGFDLGLLADFNEVNITGASFNRINAIGTLLPPNINEITNKDEISQNVETNGVKI